MTFHDTIDTVEQLREVLPSANPTTLRKIRPRFDRFTQQFVEHSPFCLIGSRNARGEMDVSPKGDPAGFAKVLDDETVVIPDRPGNGIADTLINILEKPEVALIFLVPGKGETVRVNGRARIVRDRDLMEQMAYKKKVPTLAIAVRVETVFFHCAKCVIRSGLWKPEQWPAIEDLPSLGTALAGQLEIESQACDLDERIDDSYRNRLY